MGLSRELLERQLTAAKSKLAVQATKLSAGGIVETAHRRDPIWRNLRAKCRQLARRLNTVGANEQITVDVAARKTQREEAVSVG